MKKHVIAAPMMLVAFAAIAQSGDSLFPSDLPLAPKQENPFAAVDEATAQTDTSTLLPDELVMQPPLLQPQRPVTPQVAASVPANGDRDQPDSPNSALETPVGSGGTQSQRPEATPPEGVSARVAAIENEIPRITKDDLEALNPVIPEAPTWLSTQQRLDVQFYVHKRALERESELASIRAEIAENEKRTRVALNDDDDSSQGNNRRPPMFTGVPTNTIDPNSFEQLVALSLLQGGGQQRSEPPPPPPPPPPTVVSVSADSAVVEYGGVRQTVNVGDTVGGKYRVESVDFSTVTIRDGNIRTNLTVNW